MNISDRLFTLYEMVQKSYDLADRGYAAESNELYIKAYKIAENMLNIYEISMFSDEELTFLNHIIKTFDYEQ